MSYPYPNHYQEEEPPTIDDDDTATRNEEGVSTSNSHPPSMMVSSISFTRNDNASQAQLRQQAHAPVGLGSPPAGQASITNRSNPQFDFTAGSRPVHHHQHTTSSQHQPNNPGLLQNLSLSDNPQRPSSHAIHVPEYGINTENSSSPEDSTGWSLVETNGGIPPSARSLHAAAVLNGVMYVWGGYNGDRLNTFHAFSFAEKRWSPVLPSTTVVQGPSPRDRHVAFSFGNSFFIHGGFDGASRVSDFWGFDFSSMQWREVMVLGGRPPSPRHSHAAVVHGQSLYIFGGYDGSYKSDLHEFDFTESQWSAVPAVGRRPRARYRATAVTHKNNMILHGGHDGTRHLSDTHIFDFDTRAWSTLNTEGPAPTPRDSHISVVHGNSMYVFGGSAGSAMNDLYELQLPISTTSPGKWRPVKTKLDSQPTRRFCHVGVVHSESLFVFGGYDGTERLNDFVRFDFAIHDMSFEVPPSSLIQEFRGLVDSETLSDVTFIVEETPVYAHKLMLMRSSYFRALVLGEMKESTMKTIRIELVSHPVFLQVLEYLYTDQLTIPFDSAMELFQAADLFCIPRLKTMCEKRMLQSICVENAAGIFHASDTYSAMALRNKTKKFILSHFEEVSKTQCFEEMGRCNIDLVFELLKSR